MAAGYVAAVKSAASSNPDWTWLPGVIVGSLALLFTVASFWWLNARQGRLRSFEPHSFAAAVNDAVLLLRFPLVLYNTGPKPIVVQNLRLVFPHEPHSVLPLPWRASRSEIKPHSDDGHALPAVFAVQGRSCREAFVEFGAPMPGFHMEQRDYVVRVEAHLGHKRNWRPLLTFTVRGDRITSPGQFIAYSNEPFKVSKDAKRKMDALSRGLLEHLRQVQEGEPSDHS